MHKIHITVLTLFPEFIESYKRFGIVQRAIKKNLIKIDAMNLRRFGLDARGTVDDRPYGGGVGMVLRPDIIYSAIQSWRRKQGRGRARKARKVRRQTADNKQSANHSRVILLTPQGKRFQQDDARRLLKYKNILLISGRYEGFDERVRQLVDEELSLGDYVLMGGELPALAVTEAIIRLIPGVLGKMESTEAESFSSSNGLLEYPQYTKPEVFRLGLKDERGTLNRGQGKKMTGKIKIMRVPKILLTGHHKNIESWRTVEALKRTKKRRPDLLV